MYGWTIRDATERFVSEMNAIDTEMIRRLMSADPDEWREVTAPWVGDSVYVYDIPDELDTLEHGGEIDSYDKKNGTYIIELYDGKKLSCSKNDFEIEYDNALPIWGAMWSFGDGIDDWWLEEKDGIEIMSECGFRIYESDEFGYFFGIDGAGYDFYEAHWIPLYKARGLQWHDSAAEQKYQMERRGYTKGRLGKDLCWMDGDRVVEEVID